MTTRTLFALLFLAACSGDISPDQVQEHVLMHCTDMRDGETLRH